jgi:hypothetical protein
MKAVGVVFVVAILLLATGCTRTSGDAEPPSVSDLVITPNGIQGLPIAKPVASYELVNYGEHACPTTGGWLPRYSRDKKNSADQELDPFDIDTRAGARSGPITTEYVWSKRIATGNGIRVGSSLATVRSAYPAARAIHSYSTVMYVVPGQSGQLVLELAGHNAEARGEWPANLLDTVVWMDVIPKSAKVESLAGSNDAGPCPVKGHVPDEDDD